MTLLGSQLLATKFFVPCSPHTLIPRPRLTTLLDSSLKYPLTLVSAPAGFGKTTLLADWAHSLPANHPRLCWLSLDEDENEPRLFWTYVLTALHRQAPERFTTLLMQMQLPQASPIKYVLTALINQLVESTDHFLLILDDYQVITEEQVHSSLLYLIEHLPSQLHIILSTRSDNFFPLSQLRAHRQVLEVRTNHLRCTVEEAGTFFKKIMGTQQPDEMIQQITTRTEGWLVGLQLLTLSLPQQADALILLEHLNGDQRYILDYLTEEVLRNQPQDIQTFLLSTSILERLTASLCDAVLQLQCSQQVLEKLEQANLFITSLDNKRQWYRYHQLFAQALYAKLEQTQSDLIPILHHRASIWYAQHDQATPAILHAFSGHQWRWAADLIEQKSLSLIQLTWGASQYTLMILQKWLKQLPTEIVHSRPRLCLACAQLLWQVVPYSELQVWLDAAQARLTTSLMTSTDTHISHTILAPEALQEQKDWLGMVLGFHAYLLWAQSDEETVLALCEQALSLFSAENLCARGLITISQLQVYYVSSANAAIERGHQGIMLTQSAEQPKVTICLIGVTAYCMIGAGILHDTHLLIQQAMQLANKPGECHLPDVGWPALFEASILCQWNKLDAALAQVEKAISLCKQTESINTLIYLLTGYAILLHVSLSRGEVKTARFALQQFECIRNTGMATYISVHTVFATEDQIIDKVRLWLACGELDLAIRWADELSLRELQDSPLAHERQAVAYTRILLARKLPDLALQQLEPILQTTTTSQRWGHVIEIRLLQALAFQMCDEEMKALDALSEAVRLAEPEGYIRCFVDEGASMETLLHQLRERVRKNKPTSYLDTVIAAFQQESIRRVSAREATKTQPLPESLSKRELQVLQLLADGLSNLEIAQELVITVDTVKRHVSRIFSKLGVQNRVKAANQAQALGLLREVG